MDRRLLLLSGVGLAGSGPSPAATLGEIHRFATDRCEIQLSVEFHDNYSSRGFWFDNSGVPFCLSPAGEMDRDCGGSFVGSVAIVRYQVSSHFKRRQVATMREYVTNIDRDERLEARPPFQKQVEFHGGVASDIQAFGYKDSPLPEVSSPWYYFRQDLYFESDKTPFLILHWKHTFQAIRMLDIIPAGRTRPIAP